MTAVVYGALFGSFTYATYDLTNHSTLRNWTLQLTLVDVAWGTYFGRHHVGRDLLGRQQGNSAVNGVI